MSKRRKGRTRANGEGSLFKREVTRKDGTTYERWEALVTVGYVGKKRKRKAVYARTQKEALEKMEALKRRVATGYSDSQLTVEQYLERWHTEKAREVKPRTIELYREQAKRHIIPQIGYVKLTKLAPMHLQNLCGDLADTVGKRTAEIVRIQMLGALKQAVRWQLIPRNPAEAVTPIKVPKKEITIWTADEAVRFLDVARTHRLYALFYLAISTGLRRGELLNLTWDDIKGTRLKVRTSKTRKGLRTLRLSQDVVEVLQGHRERQEAEKAKLDAWSDPDLIFTSSIGTAILSRNLERSWKRLQQDTRAKWLGDTNELLASERLEEGKRKMLEADVRALESNKLLPRLRLHDLRHLHASMLISSGKKSPVEVAERLGHTNPSFTLDVYGHLFKEHHEEEEVSILTYLHQPDVVN